MVHHFTKQVFLKLIEGNFKSLGFKSNSVTFFGEKISHDGLAVLCSLLWQKLQMHSSVVHGIWLLSPACSWFSLSYKELNCLVCVLLSDYLTLYGVSAPHVVEAWAEVALSTPFSSFLSIRKIDLE